VYGECHIPALQAMIALRAGTADSCVAAELSEEVGATAPRVPARAIMARNGYARLASTPHWASARGGLRIQSAEKATTDARLSVGLLHLRRGAAARQVGRDDMSPSHSPRVG
jgi:hypothetical protein